MRRISPRFPHSKLPFSLSLYASSSTPPHRALAPHLRLPRLEISQILHISVQILASACSEPLTAEHLVPQSRSSHTSHLARTQTKNLVYSEEGLYILHSHHQQAKQSRHSSQRCRSDSLPLSPRLHRQSSNSTSQSTPNQRSPHLRKTPRRYSSNPSKPRTSTRVHTTRLRRGNSCWDVSFPPHLLPAESSTEACGVVVFLSRCWQRCRGVPLLAAVTWGSREIRVLDLRDVEQLTFKSTYGT